MEAVEQLRIKVKKYIDKADEKVVRMVHAMLEANADENWWDEMPDDVKADVEEAMQQADRGEGMEHEEVKKKYKQWFVR